MNRLSNKDPLYTLLCLLLKRICKFSKDRFFVFACSTYFLKADAKIRTFFYLQNFLRVFFRLFFVSKTNELVFNCSSILFQNASIHYLFNEPRYLSERATKIANSIIIIQIFTHLFWNIFRRRIGENRQTAVNDLFHSRMGRMAPSKNGCSLVRSSPYITIGYPQYAWICELVFILGETAKFNSLPFRNTTILIERGVSQSTYWLKLNRYENADLYLLLLAIAVDTALYCDTSQNIHSLKPFESV